MWLADCTGHRAEYTTEPEASKPGNTNKRRSLEMTEEETEERIKASKSHVTLIYGHWQELHKTGGEETRGC